MSESERGGGKSLQDGTLFDSMRLREKQDV